MLVIRFVNNGFKQYTWRGVETLPPTVRWFKPRDKLQFEDTIRNSFTLSAENNAHNAQINYPFDEKRLDFFNMGII